MMQEFEKLSNFKSKKEDLEEFVKFLGVDYEDFYKTNYDKNSYEDIDFDDYSH